MSPPSRPLVENASADDILADFMARFTLKDSPAASPAWKIPDENQPLPASTNIESKIFRSIDLPAAIEFSADAKALESKDLSAANKYSAEAIRELRANAQMPLDTSSMIRTPISNHPSAPSWKLYDALTPAPLAERKEKPTNIPGPTSRPTNPTITAAPPANPLPLLTAKKGSSVRARLSPANDLFVPEPPFVRTTMPAKPTPLPLAERRESPANSITSKHANASGATNTTQPLAPFTTQSKQYLGLGHFSSPHERAEYLNSRREALERGIKAAEAKSSSSFPQPTVISAEQQKLVEKWAVPIASQATPPPRQKPRGFSSIAPLLPHEQLLRKATEKPETLRATTSSPKMKGKPATDPAEQHKLVARWVEAIELQGTSPLGSEPKASDTPRRHLPHEMAMENAFVDTASNISTTQISMPLSVAAASTSNGEIRTSATTKPPISNPTLATVTASTPAIFELENEIKFYRTLINDLDSDDEVVANRRTRYENILQKLQLKLRSLQPEQVSETPFEETHESNGHTPTSVADDANSLGSAIKSASISTQASKPETREDQVFFESWGKPEGRTRESPQTRKVHLRNIPKLASTREITRLICSGPLESISYTRGESSAWATFLKPADCAAFLARTANGIDWPGQENMRVVWVEAARETQPISSILQAAIARGSTRCVRLTGLPEALTRLQLQEIAEGSGTRVRGIEMLATGRTHGERAKFALVRFSSIHDAMAMSESVCRLQRTHDEWEPCNIGFAKDPCAMDPHDEERYVHWNEELGVSFPWEKPPPPCKACEEFVHCKNCREGKWCVEVE